MNTHRTRLLIVDDNAEMRKVVADCAEDAGYEVAAAATGVEALALIETSDIHVVIADIVMPSLGGIELAGRVKASRPGMAIVLMTGYTEYADAVINIGAVPLLKPFTGSVLLRAIEESLDAARSRA